MPTHIHVYMQRERYRETGIDIERQGEGKGRRQKIQSSLLKKKKNQTRSVLQSRQAAIPKRNHIINFSKTFPSLEFIYQLKTSWS